MRPRVPLPKGLHTLIRVQAGVVHHLQLRHYGLSEAVIRRISEAWVRLVRGIYLTAEPTWHSAVWAGLLHAGDGGAVGGAAACHLHGALRDAPRRVTVWSPQAKSGFAVGRWHVEFRRGQRDRRGSPPRTPLEESLLDMANRAGELETIATVSRALAQGLTTSERIVGALDGRRRVRHRGVIRQLSETSGIESVLEWLFLRDVVRPHGLPEPVRQVVTEVGRVDGAYEEHRLLLELDGLRDHVDGSRDMFRDNEHILSGRRTLRFGFSPVAREPCRVASQVAEGLRLGGWEGSLAPCGHSRGCARPPRIVVKP